MQTFQRYITVSIFTAEVTKLGSGGVEEEGPVRDKDCGKRVWTNRGVEAGCREWGWIGSKVTEKLPFSGPTGGCDVLGESLFPFPQIVNERLL
jgi:hypothetical protein